MSKELPDPKEIVDSVADGVVELAEGPVRVVNNVAAVCEGFSAEVKTNMEEVKRRLPDDPAVLADVAVKALGQTANAGLGVVEGIGKGVMDTLGGIKTQIERVTK